MDAARKLAFDAITVPEEQKEVKYVGILKIKLRYLKGSKEKMAWASQHGIDGRMWDLMEPKLKGYTYDGGYPTFTLTGLKELGVI